MTRSNFTPRTATAIIIANMIGVGVFTALGYQLADIDSLFAVMMLWIIGGLAALCGALSYAELGASLPRSGVIILALLHARSRRVSGTTQTAFTAIKIVLIAAFILAAFLLSASPQDLDLAPKANDPSVMLSVPYGIPL